MFVCREDFEEWREEETIRAFENELTHQLDFAAWEAELPGLSGPAPSAGPPDRNP